VHHCLTLRLELVAVLEVLSVQHDKYVSPLTDASFTILGLSGLESFLHYDRAEEAQNSRKLGTGNEQKRSAVSIPKFWNRKFLLQGIFRILTLQLPARAVDQNCASCYPLIKSEYRVISIAPQIET